MTWNGGDHANFHALAGLTDGEAVDISATDHTFTIGGGTVRAIQVAVAGDVVIVTPDGTDLTVFMAAGVVHPWMATAIRKTGTTATGIVGGV